MLRHLLMKEPVVVEMRVEALLQQPQPPQRIDRYIARLCGRFT